MHADADDPPAWSLEALELPFGLAPSIYAHLREHVVAGQKGLTERGERLPDEERAHPPGRIRFVSGGRDGVLGHHLSPAEVDEEVEQLPTALQAVLESVDAFQAFYERLRGLRAMSVVDPLLRAIRGARTSLHAGRFRALARFLCTRAPDREPVKLGIALLGLLRVDDETRDLLLVLGRHEEFTLFCAVAIANSREHDAELVLWELAQEVSGWGRIQIVERLAGAEDPRVRRWLLREGFRNSVMNEYLAYTCAVAGGLLEELQAERVDEELLSGAGEIVAALIAGGPAENMDDYADGAEVVTAYLGHLRFAPRSLGQHRALTAIRGFLAQKADWSARSARGWTAARRASLAAALEALLDPVGWEPLAREGLKSADRLTFFRADEVAKALGIDTWEVHFERLEAGQPNWFALTQTEDPTRIERVLAAAAELLPLDAIATGPSDGSGFGPEFAAHRELDWILQGLGRFPARGWEFVQAGLSSPAIRNRNLALRVLRTWGEDAWPSCARTFLGAALQAEPEEDVAQRIRDLLGGS